MAIARYGTRLDPDMLLRLYRHGMFPMADSADDPNLFVVDPELRGVLPLDRFHIPRRLRRTVRSEPYEVRIDTAFDAVMHACAEPQPGRETTWINSTILELYRRLHRRGYAHSVECWADGGLVGGLYGVALGGAFFGESMFARATDASKIALVHLVALLMRGGFRLLDTQFSNTHLDQFGVEELPRNEFLRRLDKALATPAEFSDSPMSGQDAVQLITQIS